MLEGGKDTTLTQIPQNVIIIVAKVWQLCHEISEEGSYFQLGGPVKVL